MKLRLILLTCITTLVSCGEKNAFAPPPPTPVGVSSPISRDQATVMEFPGHIEAQQVVEVRARAKGILKNVSEGFKAGRRVEKGTLLFEIDDVPYLAAKDTASADLAKAEAAAKIAKVTLDRRRKAGEAVSEIEVEAAIADLEAAKAQVMSAKAALRNANENLSYCKIYAPITGRISELFVDQYNLVGNGDATLLCTIVNDDLMYVYFDANERIALEYLRKRKDIGNKRLEAPVARLALADGSFHSEQATLDFADNRMDAETGTLRLRGVAANPNGKLADGLFVRVLITRKSKPSILVPNVAIQRDLAGQYVLTVNNENVVVRKNIELGDRIDALRIVDSGLTGDESIITVGLQRVREGQTVKPAPAPEATAQKPVESKEEEAADTDTLKSPSSSN